MLTLKVISALSYHEGNHRFSPQQAHSILNSRSFFGQAHRKLMMPPFLTPGPFGFYTLPSREKYSDAACAGDGDKRSGRSSLENSSGVRFSTLQYNILTYS